MTSISPPEQPQYVFLICSERSGSNLISAILGQHSEILATPPYHLGRDFVLHIHETLHLGVRSRKWDMMKNHLVNTVRSLKSDECANRLSDWLNNQTDINAVDIAHYMYYSLDKKPNTKVVFVKENNLYRILFFILAGFPNAKFVFQVRDPRDYLASAHARKKNWLGNKFGSERNAMTVWRDDQAAGLALLGIIGSQRVFFQRYEDLISRPREVLGSLCNFLNLSFEEQMLDFHSSNEVVQLSKSTAARKNIAKPLMADNFGKYRQKLSARQIKTVETWLGSLMLRFGYSLDYKDESKWSLLNILWPQLTEVFERWLNKERKPYYDCIEGKFCRKLQHNSSLLATTYDS
jgi:hypothetical protein